MNGNDFKFDTMLFIKLNPCSHLECGNVSIVFKNDLKFVCIVPLFSMEFFLVLLKSFYFVNTFTNRSNLLLEIFECFILFMSSTKISRAN